MKTIQLNFSQAKRLHYIIQNFVNDEQSLNNMSHWHLSCMLAKIVIQHDKYLRKLKSNFELAKIKRQAYIDKCNKSFNKMYLLNLQQAEYDYLVNVINSQDITFLIDNELVNLFEFENRKILN